jgi:hypothetical protein
MGFGTLAPRVKERPPLGIAKLIAKMEPKMIVVFHKAGNVSDHVYVNAKHVTHFERANPEATHTIIHFDNGA